MTDGSPGDVRVRQLDAVPLERVRAHGGEGQIDFCRLFSADDFRGPWNFVDYAVLPPGASIGHHRHGANEELYLVLDGEGTMQLGAATFTVRRGSVVVNPVGGAHGLRNTGAQPLRLFVVEIALEAGGANTPDQADA